MCIWLINQVNNIWKWLGDQNNHNALISIITFLGFLFTFNKVDSLQKSIQSIFRSIEKEVFGYKELKGCFKDIEGETQVTIKLKNKPILNSVNIWEGALHVNPNSFTVDGNVIKIFTNFNEDTLEETEYIVTYVPVI